MNGREAEQFGTVSACELSHWFATPLALPQRETYEKSWFSGL